MIRRYTFGTPYPTDAVVLSLPAETGPVPFFSLSSEGDSITLTRTLQPDDCLFGLGEAVRGVNKRGSLYRSWNSDVFNHTESTESLYASHNFLVFFGPECLFGIYLDDPGRVTWDLGYTRSDTAAITSENGQLDLYLLEEDSLTGLARSFRRPLGLRLYPEPLGLCQRGRSPERSPGAPETRDPAGRRLPGYRLYGGFQKLHLAEGRLPGPGPVQLRYEEGAYPPDSDHRRGHPA